MTDQATRHIPTAISLHTKSRLLSISFEDGQSFELPCEYLRVFSRAAEVRTAAHPIMGKELVNIERIEPQGQYAVRLVFDDGHDTGIYSWDTLYDLGTNQTANWAAYLERLQSAGYERREPKAGQKRLKLLYFAYLARRIRKDSEQVIVPETVGDVRTLIRWLVGRKPAASPLFEPTRIRVTVNRQFAEEFTRLEDGDEVAFVPTSPIAPATPGLI
jgi:DUF971 family protein/molybdopterin converting factor small subunit